MPRYYAKLAALTYAALLTIMLPTASIPTSRSHPARWNSAATCPTSPPGADAQPHP